MAGYGGYFLKGLSSGLQSGLNMASQLSEMKYQKAQRKKLAEKQKEIEDGLAHIGTLFKQYGADNVYSEEEGMQLTTAVLASIPEVQAVYKDAVSSIQTMNRKKFEEDMQWLDLFISQTEGLDPSNIQGIFDDVKGWVKTDKGKKYFEVYEIMRQKKHEADQTVTPYKFYGESSSDVKGQIAQSVAGQTPGLGDIEFKESATEAPTMADEKSAVSILRVFVNASPEVFEGKRKSLEQQKGLDLSSYTQDILKEAGDDLYNLYNTPEEVMSNVKAPKGLIIIPKRDTKTGKYYGSFSKKTTTPGPSGTRATSLPQQEKYRQDALDANTWTEAESTINRYAKAGYDTSEMPVKQDWINAKLEELDSHVEMLNEITDEKGKLMGDKQFKFMSGDEEESKTGAEWYKAIYEAYFFYLEELKKMGIDVSKYQKIKSPKEVSKVGFFKGALTSAERGYPSIYYTETTTTPTETPKLPLTE
ncbi:hypothetical protein ES704_03552 [subsurface metagenome]|jgi:hypothetical protein